MQIGAQITEEEATTTSMRTTIGAEVEAEVARNTTTTLSREETSTKTISRMIEGEVKL